jgi:hypothetical protein
VRGKGHISSFFGMMGSMRRNWSLKKRKKRFGGYTFMPP